jgi:hypothetical protein
MGSTRAARPAGTKHAKRTTANQQGSHSGNVSGTVDCTPYQKLCIRRVKNLGEQSDQDPGTAARMVPDTTLEEGVDFRPRKIVSGFLLWRTSLFSQIVPGVISCRKNLAFEAP